MTYDSGQNTIEVMRNLYIRTSNCISNPNKIIDRSKSKKDLFRNLLDSFWSVGFETRFSTCSNPNSQTSYDRSISLVGGSAVERNSPSKQALRPNSKSNPSPKVYSKQGRANSQSDLCHELFTVDFLISVTHSQSSFFTNSTLLNTPEIWSCRNLSNRRI